MNKTEQNQLRKEIRKNLINELNALAGVESGHYKMKFNMLYDLGITEVDMFIIIDKVEDLHNVELDEEDLLYTTDMPIFDIISHYNEKILKKIIKNK